MFTPNGGLKVDRAVLSKKAEQIDALIKQLRAVSRGLRHAATCSAPSHAECPTFRRLLAAAASGALRKAPAVLTPAAETRGRRRS
jgi:hypothetical protein